MLGLRRYSICEINFKDSTFYMWSSIPSCILRPWPLVPDVLLQLTALGNILPTSTLLSPATCICTSVDLSTISSHFAPSCLNLYGASGICLMNLHKTKLLAEVRQWVASMERETNPCLDPMTLPQNNGHSICIFVNISASAIFYYQWIFIAFIFFLDKENKSSYKFLTKA